MIAGKPDTQRIVITGIGLAAPNGNNLPEFRQNLLAGRSGVRPYEIRYVGNTLAGVCEFDELKYQSRKDVRRGTRAGGIGIYCARKPSRIRASTGRPSISRKSAFMSASPSTATSRRKTKSSSSRGSITTRGSGRITTTPAPWPTIPAGSFAQSRDHRARTTRSAPLAPPATLG